MVSLYDNTPDTAWAVQGWSATRRGTRFYTSAAGSISALRFYRASGQSTPSIGWIKLWSDTGTLLAQADGGSVDAGAVGWKTVALATPYSVAAGTTLRVGVEIVGSANFGRSTETPRVAAPSPLVFDDVGEWYDPGGAGWISTPQDGYMVPVDVAWDSTPPAPPGPGEGDPALTGDLNSWLSSDPDVQTHELDGLPWHIGSVVDGIEGIVSDLGDMVGHLADTASATGSLMARTAELLSRVPALVIQDIHDSFAQFFSWFGSGPKPSDQLTIPAHLDSVDDQLASLAGQVAQLAGNVEQLQAPLVGFPTDFELADSFEFVDCVAWNVAADVYVLHITTVPHGLALSPMCGVNMVRRAGWWAPLADTLPSERHFLDFEFNLIVSPAGRLPGILVELGMNGAATVEAWDRLPPPIGP